MPSDIILVELWKSSCVVLTLKCLFIMIMVLFLWDKIWFTAYTTGGRSTWCVILCLFKMYCPSVIQFSNVTFPSVLELLIFFGRGYLVLTVVRIHNVVRVRKLYSFVHGYECFGGAFWACLHTPSKDGGSMSWPQPL